MGLTWSAIDFKKSTITVRQTVRRTKTKGVHLSTTLKSDNAYRELPLTLAAATALKAHKKRQAEHRLSCGLKYHSEFDLVFPQLDGSPQDPANASATFTMDTYIHKTETMMDGVKEKLEARNQQKKQR